MADEPVHAAAVRVGERFAVSFQRTLRIPDDGRVYPLPPSLGRFPVHRVSDHAGAVPPDWRREGGLFIAMYQREALWLGFEAAAWRPNAVVIGIGRINALTGQPWDERLRGAPQNYVVCPDQPWLDGINAGAGIVRQFVAMPLGLGYTVEAQLRGAEEVGGIQILVYEPRPGRFPDSPPPPTAPPRPMAARSPAQPMGVAAGGRMQQRIYPDPYGVETWQPSPAGRLHVHILNSEQYTEVTGALAPPTPVDARTYTEAGLPWFDLYDESRGSLEAAAELARVLSLGAIDATRGVTDAADAAFRIDPNQVRAVKNPGGGGAGRPGRPPADRRADEA